MEAGGKLRGTGRSASAGSGRLAAGRDSRKRTSLWRLGVLSLAVVPVVAFAWLAQAQSRNGLPASGRAFLPLIYSQEVIPALRDRLAQDFDLTDETFEKVSLVYLCCRGILASCFGNNAGAPYLTFTQELQGLRVPQELTLDPDEALVLVGRTPPPVRYYSYRSYLFSRYTGDPEERLKLFVSLGDTLNNLTLQTGVDQRGGFYQPVMIIITADLEVDSRIRAAARAAGIPAEIINTDVIPSSVVRMGQGNAADHLVFLHRLMLPLEGHQDAVEDYLRNPGYRAWRLKPNEAIALNPFPMPPMRARGSGTSELDLMPDLERLRAAILAERPGRPYTELTTGVWLPEGFDGLQRGVNLLGENRDPLYLSTDLFTLSEDPDDFLIAYGVLHEKTDKALYSNVSVYGDELKIGITGVNSPDLMDTASPYLGDSANAEKFYVWKIARNCNGEANCLTVVPREECPLLDLDKDLFVVFRAYLEPTTRVGPAYYEMLYDQVIHFTPRP